MGRLQAAMQKPKFRQVVTDRQLGAQLGNAMSVNVLERLLVRILPCAGLVPARKLHDRWEAKAAKATKAKNGPKQLERAAALEAKAKASAASRKRPVAKMSVTKIVSVKKRK